MLDSLFLCVDHSRIVNLVSDKGLRCIFYVSKQTRPPGSPSIPQSLPGISCPLPWTFQPRGWAAPPLEALLYIIRTFLSPPPYPHHSTPAPFLSFPFPPSPWQLPWPPSLGPLNSPTWEQLPINLHLINLIWFELAHFTGREITYHSGPTQFFAQF